MGLTLRVVISFFCAFIVLAVAGVTFGVTYNSSLTTVRDLGVLYSSALAAIGRAEVETYFRKVTLDNDAMAQTVLMDTHTLPMDDPTIYDELEKMTWLLTTLGMSYGEEYSFGAMIYDDGSLAAYSRGGPLVIKTLKNGVTLNATTRCCLTQQKREYLFPSMTELTTTLAPLPPPYDSRFDAYNYLRDVVLAAFPAGAWNTIAYDDTVGNYLSCMRNLRNNSGTFLGIGSFGLKLDAVELFLRNISLTPRAHMFVVDSQSSIFATTHPTSPFSFSYTTNRTYVPPPTCASSAATAFLSVTNFTIVCRATAATFPFAPLNAVANDRAVIAPTGSLVERRTLGSEGTYFIASVKLRNRMANFGYSLVLLMPEDDILGDIVARRNIVIIIVCCVFVAATVLSFVLVSVVLQPLATVSRRMRRTAKLQEATMETRLSGLSEIHDLQVAYNDMNTAIGSFTRYVPRDVVQDLIASGQLCQIKMDPFRCSMLFIDIASFTTMCERVPAAQLSDLVRIYFEHMSKIVMKHGGLIDKYIGDCIMAVWGAPVQIIHQEVKATLAALLMVRETQVGALVSSFDQAGERIAVRVGVATGEVLAGNMGSSERMNYTVIGDSVNLAARLESLNKQFGTSIMAPQDTIDGLQSMFCTRLLSRITVVGKKHPVKVYQILGLNPDAANSGIAELEKQEEETNPFQPKPSGQEDDDAESVKTNNSAMSMSCVSEVVSTREVLASFVVRDALRLFPDPPVATERVARSAKEFTDAVEQLQRGEYAAALASLETLEKSGDAPATATKLLIEMAESALRDPAAFNGVFNAVDK